MRIEVLGAQEAHVVAGHHRQTLYPPEGHGGLQMALIVGPAATLQLQIEPFLKPAAQFLCTGLCLLDLAGEQGTADLRSGPGQGDQALGPGRHPVAGDQRPAAGLAFGVAAGNQAHQVAVAHFVAGQQRQQLRRRIRFLRLQPDIRTRDRLDPGRLRGLVELDHREQVAVVGQRQGAQPQLGRAFGQRLLVVLQLTLFLARGNPDQAVAQRVFAVQMQVYVTRSHGANCNTDCATGA